MNIAVERKLAKRIMSRREFEDELKLAAIASDDKPRDLWVDEKLIDLLRKTWEDQQCQE